MNIFFSSIFPALSLSSPVPSITSMIRISFNARRNQVSMQKEPERWKMDTLSMPGFVLAFTRATELIESVWKCGVCSQTSVCFIMACSWGIFTEYAPRHDCVWKKNSHRGGPKTIFLLLGKQHTYHFQNVYFHGKRRMKKSWKLLLSDVFAFQISKILLQTHRRKETINISRLCCGETKYCTSGLRLWSLWYKQ